MICENCKTENLQIVFEVINMKDYEPVQNFFNQPDAEKYFNDKPENVQDVCVIMRVIFCPNCNVLDTRVIKKGKLAL